MREVGGEKVNYKKKIIDIEKTIKNAELKQIKVVEDMASETIIKKEDTAKFLAWQTYESIIINLETQKSILEALQDSDSITILAYRVALISFGAGLISIISTLI